MQIFTRFPIFSDLPVDRCFPAQSKKILSGFFAVLFFLSLTLLFPISAQAQVASCPAGKLPVGESSTGTLDATHTSDIWCIALREDDAFGVADE